MKTFTLDVEYACDFDLFGLVSSSREHTLAWTLNRALRLRLIKQPDLLLRPAAAEAGSSFSNYLHATEYPHPAPAAQPLRRGPRP